MFGWYNMVVIMDEHDDRETRYHITARSNTYVMIIINIISIKKHVLLQLDT